MRKQERVLSSGILGFESRFEFDDGGLGLELGMAMQMIPYP